MMKYDVNQTRAQETFSQLSVSQHPESIENDCGRDDETAEGSIQAADCEFLSSLASYN